MLDLGFKYEVNFTSGKEVSRLAQELVKNIEDNKGHLLESYYTFCLLKLLDSYKDFLMESFKVSPELLEEQLSKEEDLIYKCIIRGKDYVLKSSTKEDYSFDKDALKAKGLCFKDGSPVKDMTGFARWCEEQEVATPNFICKSKEKTIYSFDKKIAASFESDELVKKEVSKVFKF